MIPRLILLVDTPERWQQLTVSEIAPDVFRMSTFVQDFNLQFNQFLVRDDDPLLIHTGTRAMFAAVRDAARAAAACARGTGGLHTVLMKLL